MSFVDCIHDYITGVINTLRSFREGFKTARSGRHHRRRRKIIPHEPRVKNIKKLCNNRNNIIKYYPITLHVRTGDKHQNRQSGISRLILVRIRIEKKIVKKGQYVIINLV